MIRSPCSREGSGLPRLRDSQEFTDFEAHLRIERSSEVVQEGAPRRNRDADVLDECPP